MISSRLYSVHKACEFFLYEMYRVPMLTGNRISNKRYSQRKTGLLRSVWICKTIAIWNTGLQAMAPVLWASYSQLACTSCIQFSMLGEIHAQGHSERLLLTTSSQDSLQYCPYRYNKNRKISHCKGALETQLANKTREIMALPKYDTK